MNDRPVYPERYPGGSLTRSGMTLREYFIAASLQGLLANSEFSDWDHTTVAACAIEQADVVMRRLEDEKEEPDASP